jgi:UDP-N-acetyl-D-galactosamine dehydrogenase
VRELAEYEVTAEVYDPWVSSAAAEHEYGFGTLEAPEPGAYDAIVVAVAHQQFKAMGASAIRALGKPEHVLFDLKYILSAEESDLRL